MSQKVIFWVTFKPKGSVLALYYFLLDFLNLADNLLLCDSTRRKLRKFLLNFEARNEQFNEKLHRKLLITTVKGQNVTFFGIFLKALAKVREVDFR